MRSLEGLSDFLRGSSKKIQDSNLAASPLGLTPPMLRKGRAGKY